MEEGNPLFKSQVGLALGASFILNANLFLSYESTLLWARLSDRRVCGKKIEKAC